MRSDMKILVVDDELVSREKIRRIMEHFGQCKSVESGEAAIAAFHEAWNSWSPYDLITLDISMPTMSGLETLQTLREIEKEKNVPEEKRVKIIMATSEADRDTVVTCLSEGCNDYIVKPFNQKTIGVKLPKIIHPDTIQYHQKRVET
jgi:two-component system, chemotaxis family, chemotaxis protein CheY